MARFLYSSIVWRNCIKGEALSRGEGRICKEFLNFITILPHR